MKPKLKKSIKITIIISVIVLFVVALIGTYFIGLTPVSKKYEEVTFVVDKGKSKIDIVNDLHKANLIKSKLSGYVYVILHNMNLQAGTYKLSRSMSSEDIYKYINDGKIESTVKTYRITFVEGKPLKKYVEQIVERTKEDYDEVINSLKDKDYLNSLIEKYSFIDKSILNDKLYYPLEGYVFPSTYEVYESSKAKDIITKMLDGMNAILKKYENEISTSKYNMHEILTMATIIELEGTNKENRAGISQVIHSRLNKKMSLGMDVTSYYGMQIDLKEVFTAKMRDDDNAYNTRRAGFIGLPVGPISCPSEESINAVFNPSKTDYLYFYADIKTGKVYFAKTASEHQALIKKYS